LIVDLFYRVDDGRLVQWWNADQVWRKIWWGPYMMKPIDIYDFRHATMLEF